MSGGATASPSVKRRKSLFYSSVTGKDYIVRDHNNQTLR